MEALINKLRDLDTESFVTYCIKQWINTGVSANNIIGEIKSIAADNPPMMERALGSELYNEILKVEVCG